MITTKLKQLGHSWSKQFSFNYLLQSQFVISTKWSPSRMYSPAASIFWWLFFSSLGPYNISTWQKEEFKHTLVDIKCLNDCRQRPLSKSSSSFFCWLVIYASSWYWINNFIIYLILTEEEVQFELKLIGTYWSVYFLS